MSILHTSEQGWFISHEKLINSYYLKVIDDGKVQSHKIVSSLFEIQQPFRKPEQGKRKRKQKHKDCSFESFKQLRHTIEHIQNAYQTLRIEICHLLQPDAVEDIQVDNDRAIQLSQKVYDESDKVAVINTIGENRGEAKYITINNSNFIFPSNCKFYCKDIADIEHYILDIKYDLILIDPPWWNKYIRRKKAKTNHGYQMMYNDTLKEIPIEGLLDNDGLLVVWCTNSLLHLDALQSTIFPKWNIQSTVKWYWLKITRSGEPICRFSEPPGKQPFEQIIIGCRNTKQEIISLDGKLVVSIPSALHSHKPPLIELLSPYLPKNPQCLELFARYLLPNCTSWGLEAIKFQHESLYELNVTPQVSTKNKTTDR